MFLGVLRACQWHEPALEKVWVGCWNKTALNNRDGLSLVAGPEENGRQEGKRKKWSESWVLEGSHKRLGHASSDLPGSRGGG